MNVPQFLTDNVTGETYYHHPLTNEVVYLEPEDDKDEITEGWQEYIEDGGKE